ncbi:DUF6415 family natural product biosynthesis protein [Streptomyces sp. NPDC012888]|uniref:DUF6415 family natural product biosynthesis protein n=1 Tax=Streptomyces sp. NPDC012888 TaxID=3364855 RepID=UPI00368A49CF
MHADDDRHDRPAIEELVASVDVTAVLTAIADAVDEAVERDIDAALAMQHVPPPFELAEMTTRLITACAVLAPQVERIPHGPHRRAGEANADAWRVLADDGPGEGPLGNWSYARQLAVTARGMLRAVQAAR